MTGLLILDPVLMEYTPGTFVISSIKFGAIIWSAWLIFLRVTLVKLFFWMSPVVGDTTISFKKICDFSSLIL